MSAVGNETLGYAGKDVNPAGDALGWDGCCISDLFGKDSDDQDGDGVVGYAGTYDHGKSAEHEFSMTGAFWAYEGLKLSSKADDVLVEKTRESSYHEGEDKDLIHASKPHHDIAHGSGPGVFIEVDTENNGG